MRSIKKLTSPGWRITSSSRAPPGANSVVVGKVAATTTQPWLARCRATYAPPLWLARKPCAWTASGAGPDTPAGHHTVESTSAYSTRYGSGPSRSALSEPGGGCAAASSAQPDASSRTSPHAPTPSDGRAPRFPLLPRTTTAPSEASRPAGAPARELLICRPSVRPTTKGGAHAPARRSRMIRCYALGIAPPFAKGLVRDLRPTGRSRSPARPTA